MLSLLGGLHLPFWSHKARIGLVLLALHRTSEGVPSPQPQPPIMVQAVLGVGRVIRAGPPAHGDTLGDITALVKQK